MKIHKSVKGIIRFCAAYYHPYFIDYDAVKEWSKVTCKRCLKKRKKI